jgi:hypothetical protein
MNNLISFLTTYYALPLEADENQHCERKLYVGAKAEDKVS